MPVRAVWVFTLPQTDARAVFALLFALGQRIQRLACYVAHDTHSRRDRDHADPKTEGLSRPRIIFLRLSAILFLRIGLRRRDHSGLAAGVLRLYPARHGVRAARLACP